MVMISVPGNAVARHPQVDCAVIVAVAVVKAAQVPAVGFHAGADLVARVELAGGILAAAVAWPVIGNGRLGDRTIPRTDQVDIGDFIPAVVRGEYILPEEKM